MCGSDAPSVLIANSVKRAVRSTKTAFGRREASPAAHQKSKISEDDASTTRVNGANDENRSEPIESSAQGPPNASLLHSSQRHGFEGVTELFTVFISE